MLKNHILKNPSLDRCSCNICRAHFLTTAEGVVQAIQFVFDTRGGPFSKDFRTILKSASSIVHPPSSIDCVPDLMIEFQTLFQCNCEYSNCIPHSFMPIIQEMRSLKLLQCEHAVWIGCCIITFVRGVESATNLTMTLTMTLPMTSL